MTQLESTTRNRIADMYPLSPMQKGLLFHSLLTPEDGLYMPHVILDLRGDLNTKRLRSAFEDALAEHAVLRTGVFWDCLLYTSPSPRDS